MMLTFLYFDNFLCVSIFSLSFTCWFTCWTTDCTITRNWLQNLYAMHTTGFFFSVSGCGAFLVVCGCCSLLFWMFDSFFLSFRHWCKTIDLNWSLEGNNFNKELRAQHLNFFFFGHWICNNKSLRQLNLTWNCIQLDAKWYWFLMKFGNFGNEMCVWVGWIPGYLRIATQKVHGNVY